MKTLLRHAASTTFLLTAVGSAQAQATPNLETSRSEVALHYTATRGNSPPGSCGCFYLQGAALEAALPLSRSFSATLEVAGNHAGLVPSTARALSTITLMAGVRYTRTFGLRSEPFVQGLAGAVRGFDAAFPQSSGTNDTADTATGLALALGGGYAFRLTRAVTLLPVQVDFVQTNLPNGVDGRQRNLRFSTGVRFHVGFGLSRR